MIYLLNFNMTYIIIFATCFDSYESSSGINFKNYCTYCFTVIMSYSFLSNYNNNNNNNNNNNCKTICTVVLEIYA